MPEGKTAITTDKYPALTYGHEYAMKEGAKRIGRSMA
jgi:hypothetical protein